MQAIKQTGTTFSFATYRSPTSGKLKTLKMSAVTSPRKMPSAIHFAADGEMSTDKEARKHRGSAEPGRYLENFKRQ